VKGKVKIDEDLCKGCNYCVLACPKSALQLKKEFNKKGYFPAQNLRPDDCTGCALCAEVCPEMAIEVWREEQAHSSK
jgi:2-oxoglutarate ferredoxin oxidoreductase subunit delta